MILLVIYFLLKHIYFYLFIWLVATHSIFDLQYGIQDLLWDLVVAAHGAFGCGMWTPNCDMQDLFPWPGTGPGPPALGMRSLNHWTAGEVPFLFISIGCLSVPGLGITWPKGHNSCTWHLEVEMGGGHNPWSPPLSPSQAIVSLETAQAQGVGSGLRWEGPCGSGMALPNLCSQLEHRSHGGSLCLMPFPTAPTPWVAVRGWSGAPDVSPKRTEVSLAQSSHHLPPLPLFLPASGPLLQASPASGLCDGTGPGEQASPHCPAMATWPLGSHPAACWAQDKKKFQVGWGRRVCMDVSVCLCVCV